MNDLPERTLAAVEKYGGWEGVLAALKDAERYRWLRKEHESDGPSYHVRRPSNCPAPRDLDAELDAVMNDANSQVKPNREAASG